MTNDIYWMLETEIKAGEIEQLKTLMAEMVSTTEADEPGTVNYEWFVSADESTCHIYERYADSAALMRHLGNFGEKFAKRFMSILQPSRMMVYGEPTDEVIAALSGLNAEFMAPLGGFNRQ
jgi:quinol monooxygenase YgiN